VVCSCAYIGDKFLMGFADGKISTLVKLLEPFLRKQIRDILGDTTGILRDGETYIQGTPFPQVDLSDGYTGTDAVVLTPDGSLWDESETAQAERSAILGAFSCFTEPTVTDSIAWGWAGKTYKNPCSVSAGYMMYDLYESQAGRYTESSEITMSDSWQTIGSIYMRGFTHIWADVPGEEWNTAGFHAYIAGIEIDAVRSYSYKVIATTKLRNGSMTLLQEDVTTLFETDANFDLQVVVNDSTDALDFQVKDSGNSGRSVKWCVHARTSEAIGASIYHMSL